MLNRIAALVVLASTSFAHAQAPVSADRDRASVRAALAARRAHNLASFHKYVETGVYPHNTYREGPLNVWLDASGHFCAAATMIKMDGHPDLVDETARQGNNLRLLDVTSGPLLSWMLTSGLTIEEIDQIQEPGFEPPVVSPAAYKAEDKKLLVKYRATEKYLRAHESADLDIATDRLMKQPELAQQFFDDSAEAPTKG